MAPKLVLASTSEARRRLVQQLGLEVTCVAPTCDEHALHGRTPDDTALIRAFAKAESVRGQFPADAFVIGSDQLVDLDGQILGKPGTAERARAQLASLAGRTHRLVTAVVVLGPGVRESRIVVCKMTMRPLTEAEIAAYVVTDAPEHCAGSYKYEQTGRHLFASVRVDDETAIEGLPVGVLSGMLGPHFRHLRDGQFRGNAGSVTFAP